MNPATMRIGFPSLRKCFIHNIQQRQLRTTINKSVLNNYKLQYRSPYQYRGLHAAWSILLNHTFLYTKLNPSVSLGKSLEETDLPSEDTPTILFLHDAHADMQQSMDLARTLMQRKLHTLDTKKACALQCMLVDIRGCGDSDGDDYDTPHTVETATEDVLTLVQTVCPSSSPPECIVAFGVLGRALAMQYANLTKQGGMTQNTHSEVTGSGAVPCPKYIFLLPTVISNGSASNTETDAAAAIEYVYDIAISESLAESALKYTKHQEDIYSDTILVATDQEGFLQKALLLYD